LNFFSRYYQKFTDILITEFFYFEDKLIGFAVIEQIVERGIDVLSAKQCHQVDKNNKISELIKGDIRLLFFKGHGDTIIVTTHAFIKKTQKTTDKDKNKAIRHKKAYQLAHDKNQIIYVKDEE
jgi:phage-related protein